MLKTIFVAIYMESIRTVKPIWFPEERSQYDYLFFVVYLNDLKFAMMSRVWNSLCLWRAINKEQIINLTKQSLS